MKQLFNILRNYHIAPKIKLSSVKTMALSHRGHVRINNEDQLIWRDYDHNPEWFNFEKNGLSFAIADGMGGHAAGEVASALACNLFIDYYYKNKENISRIIPLLEYSFYHINEAILMHSLKNSQYNGMGTTLSVLVFHQQTAYIAHIGDSRIYLLRNGYLKKLTYDHTQVQQLVERGILTIEEAQKHPQKNILTQALGVDQSIQVFTWSGKLKKKDIFLLCSDGLYDMLNDHDIRNIMMDHIHSPFDMCHALINEALSNGGRDNVSSMVVKI